MSPAHVIEPTYLGIKTRLKQGAWPMGMRLEGAKLADELGVSVTPVRDSLNRLVGERLVELWPGEGYRVARLSERLLRDLLQFNSDLLSQAISAGAVGAIGIDPIKAGSPYPERIALMFSELAAVSRNMIVIEAVDALNDRLHAARCLDPQLIDKCEAEFAVFGQLIAKNADPAARIDWLASYHERRCELASDYVSRLEQGPLPS